jgi:MFS family permease
MPRRSFDRTAAIFGVLRNRDLRSLWFSDWISDVGNFITAIALAVYVNNLTGTATGVGVALALHSVPWFTIGPFAGVLVDRLDRRSVMITSCLCRAVLVGILPFTHAAWQAYALSFAVALFGPLFQPARSAFLAQVAPEGRLVPALAVTETTHQVLHMVGPAIGGLAVLLVGARQAFFLDAASFVMAAAFLVTIGSRGRPVRERGTTLGDLRAGFHAIVRAPAVRAYAFLNAALSLGFAGVIALLVVYVRDVLGRPGGQFGLVLSVAGLGTVVTSLVIAARDDRHSRTPWVVASVAGVGTFALAWFEPSFLFLIPIALAAGLADSGAGIPMSATIAEQLQDEVRGRANSVVDGLYELATAIGSLVFAWLGEPGRLGPAKAMAASAVTGSGLGVLVLLLGGAAAIARHEQRRLAARPAAG